MAAAVEDWSLDPGKVRAEADAPDNAGDSLVNQVQFAARLLWRPGWLIALTGRRINRVLLDVLVDRSIDSVVHRVGAIQTFGQVVGEQEPRALQSVQTTD